MTSTSPPPLWTTWGKGITRRCSPVALRAPSAQRRRPVSYTTSRDAPSPIGETVDAIRDALGWLGKCNVDRSEHSTHLYFRFVPEADAGARMRVKVEINGREHGALYGFKTYPFAVDNPWFTGKADIVSFEADELFSTKLRALLQRRKNRDLFDLREGLAQMKLDPKRVVDGFAHYLKQSDAPISRAEAEMIMLRKLGHSLTEDIAPLLPAGVAYNDADARAAFGAVWHKLIALIDGEPWKKSQATIEALRKQFGTDFLAQ